MHPDKKILMEKMNSTNPVPPMIIVSAYFKDMEMGREEFQPGTNLDHIMNTMLKKYGQVASFTIYVPPMAAMSNK